MADFKTELIDIIDSFWRRGKAKGLSDREITEMIEQAIQERMKERTQRKKYDYTPMTDEEIKASQEKLNSTPKVEVHKVEMPQVLYGPPPTQKVEVHKVEMPQVLYGPPPVQKVEVHKVEMPQVLYGPPPKEEIHEMFVDPVTGEVREKPKNK